MTAEKLNQLLINNMNNPAPNPAPALAGLSVSGAQTDAAAADLMAAGAAR